MGSERNRGIDWATVAAADLARTAYHEAGHAIVLWHFRIPWNLTNLQAMTPTLESKGSAGQVLYFRCDKATPFRLAAVGWAGVMAEGMHDDPNDWDEWLCFDCYWVSCEDMSESDRSLIQGTPFVWRALRTAAGILRRRWAEVERQAEAFLPRARQTGRDRTGMYARG